jgi:DNA invertase Pin-like site-specific DNA recombinase
MRGAATFKNIFDNTLNNEIGKRKGRNSNLIEQRNEALVKRFYFYSAFTKMDYESRIKLIAKEFYISVSTVSQLLAKWQLEIKEIKKQKPKISDLKKEYPHYNWSIDLIKIMAA